MIGADRRYTTTVGVVLGLIFLATLTLTVQSIRSATNQRRVARASLESFADQAAWNFAARMEARLYTGLARMFRGVAANSDPLFLEAEGPKAVQTALREARECRCGLVIAAHRTFALDPLSGRLYSDSLLDSAFRIRLANRLTRFATTNYEKRWDGAMLTLTGPDQGTIVMMTVRWSLRDEPAAIYGFIADPESVRSDLLGFVMGRFALLPPTEGIPSDSLLTVTVTDSSGFVLFRSVANEPGRASGSATTGHYAGSLRVDASIRERGVGYLLPSTTAGFSTGPLLGLLATTAALLIAAGALFRRAALLAAARANFTSSISHELKTPLTQIILYGETMTLGRLQETADYRREARVIVDEAKHLLALVDNVLHATRMGRADLPLDLAKTSLATAAGPVLSSLAVRAEIQGVELQVEIDPGAEAILDRSAFQGILRNLVDNAFKYGNGSRIEVVIRRSAGYSELVVEDGGPGIAAVDRARVWNLFSRLDRAPASTGGSGVGLAVVGDLVRRQRGIIELSTGGRGGARFAVRFPIPLAAESANGK